MHHAVAVLQAGPRQCAHHPPASGWATSMHPPPAPGCKPLRSPLGHSPGHRPPHCHSGHRPAEFLRAWVPLKGSPVASCQLEKTMACLFFRTSLRAPDSEFYPARLRGVRGRAAGLGRALHEGPATPLPLQKVSQLLSCNQRRTRTQRAGSCRKWVSWKGEGRDGAGPFNCPPTPFTCSSFKTPAPNGPL